VSVWLEGLVRGTGYRGDIDQFVAFSDMAEFFAAPLLALPSEPRVAYVGTLDGPKGVDVLIEAWTRVIEDVPQAQLVIAGDGPLRESLVARCTSLGLNRTAEFVGHLSSSRVRALLDRCACLVVPSRSEGLGRVALEAMARARPVVASKVGGLPELVEDGRNGLLITPEDPEQLAAAIVGLLQDADKLVEMGREGRRRALQRDPVAEFESGISRLAAWVGAV